MWGILLLAIFLNTPVSSVPQLKLVHVVFSHKFYAPVKITSNNGTVFPDKLDYRYFLEAVDEMNNIAKMDLFNLGVFLRKRYDKLLGDIYHPDFVKMRTSEYVLSMISGLLVDAGLWPPTEEQKWNEELDWQPIPTEYDPIERDTVMLGYLCPNFVEDELKASTNFSSTIASHIDLFDYLTRHYGQKIQTFSDTAALYSCLQTILTSNCGKLDLEKCIEKGVTPEPIIGELKAGIDVTWADGTVVKSADVYEPNIAGGVFIAGADLNLTLPDWSEGIYPDGEMKNATLLNYELLSKTRLQKELNGGSILKKIILDSVDHEISNATRKLRISMYSGEDRNVVGVLQSMDVWLPHILSSGASIFFEVYSDSITREYTIKILYFTGVNYYNVIPLTLNECDDYCPLMKFARLLDHVLPVDEVSLCYKKRISLDKENSAVRLTNMILIPEILISLILIGIS